MRLDPSRRRLSYRRGQHQAGALGLKELPTELLALIMRRLEDRTCLGRALTALGPRQGHRLRWLLLPTINRLVADDLNRQPTAQQMLIVNAAAVSYCKRFGDGVLGLDSDAEGAHSVPGWRLPRPSAIKLARCDYRYQARQTLALERVRLRALLDGIASDSYMYRFNLALLT